MQIPDEQKDIPIKCYVIGRLLTLSLEEAYELFWKMSFAWLLPLDWFRSGFEKSEKTGYVSKVAQFSGMEFGYKLLTRRTLALAINSPCMLDEHGYGPSRGAFIRYAHRFGELFPNKARPYESTQVIDDRGLRQLAYRMKPDEKWLIVVGVDPESEFKNTEIDWNIFQKRPI